MVSVGGRRMKIKKILTITTLLFIVLFGTACNDLNPIKKDHQTAIIEMDGDVSYQFYDNVDIKYKQILDYNYFYKDTNISVDNNMYNFIIIIPFKSKTNLQALFPYTYIKISSKNKPTDAGDVNLLNNDAYFHYQLIKSANGFASYYYLNDVEDMEISYLYEQSNFSEDIKYDTNKLIIPKEQLINLLDSLAIPHDRLEFQTD